MTPPLGSIQAEHQRTERRQAMAGRFRRPSAVDRTESNQRKTSPRYELLGPQKNSRFGGLSMAGARLFGAGLWFLIFVFSFAYATDAAAGAKEDFMAAHAAAAGGDHGLAVSLYDKVLQYPDVPVFNRAVALNNRALSLHKLGRAEEALTGYDACLEMNPNYALAYFNRSIVWEEMGRLADALADMEKFRSLEPDDKEAQSRIAALRAMIQNQARKPEPIAANHFNLGNQAFENGDFDEAIRQFTTAMSAKGASGELLARMHFNRGNAWFRKGEYKLAVDDFRAALELAPTHARIHGNLAVALARLGQWESALESARQALNLAPGEKDYHELLELIEKSGRAANQPGGFTVDSQAGNPSTAEQAEAGGAPQPADPEADRLSRLIASGKLDSLDQAAALVELAKRWLSLQRPDLALRDCDRALTMDRTNTMALLNRSRALEALGRHDEALTDMRRLMKLAPGFAEGEKRLKTLKRGKTP